MPDDEESDEIVVTGRRGGKAKPFESFAVDIDIDTGGTFDNLTDGLPESLRALLVNETDFDVDETLTAKQKEMAIMYFANTSPPTRQIRFHHCDGLILSAQQLS